MNAVTAVSLAVAAVLIGCLDGQFFDVYALWLPIHDFTFTPPSASKEPNCVRLRGPVGSEDAVILEGDLLEGEEPIIIAGELDAIAHEFTNRQRHGTDASPSPRGALFAVDRLSRSIPRLTRLEVPLPEGVTDLHTHGLGLHGDVLFAINHAFRGGGERIERWRVTRL